MNDGGSEKKWQRRTARFLLVMAVIIVSGFGVWKIGRAMIESKRTSWKESALVRLQTLSLTNERVRLELEELKRAPGINEVEWTRDHVLVMTDGQYIVYEYRHGRNGNFPPHLFLGHSSDGQWLYSSYHFCNDMAMIRFDNQPGSIAEFSKKYFIRSFDGKSDECLKLTW